MRSIKIKKIYIALTCLVLACSILQQQFNFIKVKPLIENRSKAAFPNAPIYSKKFFEQFTTYFNDNYGFRDLFIKLNNTIEYSLFKTSPNPQVIVGKGDWLFYKDEISDYTGKLLISDEQMSKLAQNISDLSNKLNKQGIKFIFMVAPNKSSIYPEFVPNRYAKSNLSNYDRLVSELKKKEINVFDPKPLLLENKSNFQLYYKKDTHWNDYAAYLVSNQIIANISQMTNIKQPALTIANSKEVVNYNDLNNMMGVDVTVKEMKPSIDIPKISNHFPNLLWYHDSFASAVSPLITPYFDERVMLHNLDKPINTTLTSNLQDKKIVIFQIVERNIPVLVKQFESVPVPSVNYKEVQKFNALDFENINNLNISTSQVIEFKSSDVDSNFELKSSIPSDDPNKDFYLKLTISNTLDKEATQIFYRSENETYSEEKSIIIPLEKEQRTYYVKVPNTTKNIRIDPLNGKGSILFKEISLVSTLPN